MHTLLINGGRALFVGPTVIITSLRWSPPASFINRIWQGIFVIRNGDKTKTDQRKIFDKRTIFLDRRRCHHTVALLQWCMEEDSNIIRVRRIRKRGRQKKVLMLNGHHAELHLPYSSVVLKLCFMLPLRWRMRDVRWQSCAPRSCLLRVVLHSKTVGATQAKAQEKSSCKHNGSCSLNKQDERKNDNRFANKIVLLLWVGLLCINMVRFVHIIRVKASEESERKKKMAQWKCSY